MPEQQYFLGLHIGHDRAISVADGNTIIFHTAVERLDRCKHSDSYKIPIDEIKLILAYLNIDIEEFEGACISYLAVDASRVTTALRSTFREAFPSFQGRFSTLDHHLAHALGAKVCSGYDDATVIVADGAGDQRLWGSQSESVFHVSDTEFYILDERVQSPPLTYINRPEFYDPSYFRPEDHQRQISLGLKYEQITYLCGFGPGQAGQTMALAAFGNSLFDYRSYLPVDLSFSLRYTDFLKEFDELAIAEEMSLIQYAKIRRADIAATFQNYLEDSLSIIIKSIVEKFPTKKICFSGGLFLNCLSNRRLFDENPNIEIFYFAACNDEGQSLGTVSYAYWQKHSILPKKPPAFPYLGREFTDEFCEAEFIASNTTYNRLNRNDLLDSLSSLLSQGAIVGLLIGRSECGPRALGHRSIIADPRTLNTKKRLDEGIKRRAEFRPYAPMMLEDDVSRYTDFDSSASHMLVTASVHEEVRPEIPCVVHVDGSTRIQTVSKSDDLFLYDLLVLYRQKTGHSVLLNTSFNDELEPMIDSPKDALRVFASTDMDVLVMGNCLHVRPK